MKGRYKDIFGPGVRVKTDDSSSMKAWGCANMEGTVLGGDPRGTNPDVRSVRLDKKPQSIITVKGVHISHLTVIENVPKLTPAAKKGLQQLWDDTHKDGFRRNFPGAIGRAGTVLVKLGLAERVGRHVYANNRPEMGERPDAAVKFKFTDKGRKVAAQLFGKLGEYVS